MKQLPNTSRLVSLPDFVQTINKYWITFGDLFSAGCWCYKMMLVILVKPIEAVGALGLNHGPSVKHRQSPGYFHPSTWWRSGPWFIGSYLTWQVAMLLGQWQYKYMYIINIWYISGIYCQLGDYTSAYHLPPIKGTRNSYLLVGGY